jgi:hypothetical protein
MLRSERRSIPFFAFRSRTAACCMALAVACLAPGAVAQAQVRPDVFPDADDFAREFQKARDGQQKQFVDFCRQYAEMAEEEIAARKTKRDDLAAELEKIQSAIADTRQKATAASKETQAARRAQRDREAAILAEQSADSPYGVAQTELQRARDDQDRIILKTLGLPARSGSVTEQQRGAERSKYTASQKSRLKASPECDAASERVTTALRAANEEKKKLLEADKEYQAIATRVAAAVEAEDSAEAAAKAAGLDVNRVRKDLKASDSALAAARKVLAQADAALAQLGAPREKK